jgi:hypothetical protein
MIPNPGKIGITMKKIIKKACPVHYIIYSCPVKIDAQEKTILF